jgi:hypothetical protein
MAYTMMPHRIAVKAVKPSSGILIALERKL